MTEQNILRVVNKRILELNVLIAKWPNDDTYIVAKDEAVYLRVLLKRAFKKEKP